MPFDDRDFPNLPKGERAMSPRSRRLVGTWLYCVAGMILVMIGLGGATRVSGSGLSIMEWAPIMGALPPLTETEWHRLYALYQQIPQYSLVNDGFGLAGFKRIFWLEWTHRLWGRLIGAAFLIPLVWFALTGRLERRLIPRLAGFLLLGGLQGAVGWFMVESGFFADATAVEPVRLVAHLGLALILYAMVLWTAMTLLPPRPQVIEAGRALKLLGWTTLGMVALTIVAGGFVAGLHAGLTYNTFPWMDGRLVPEGYTDLQPFARNLIANVATVQFDHRLLATVTLVLASALAIAAWPYRERLGWRAAFLGAAVWLQYALGVATLLLAVPAGLAVPHQIGATLLLTAVLLITHATRRAARPVPRSVRGQTHGQTPRDTPLQRSVKPPSGQRTAAPRSVTEDPRS
jgi:cytochrome c oxidase assembly protein subunit 15